jgi:uncharacterized protein YjbI with pentapeptide repeats
MQTAARQALFIGRSSRCLTTTATRSNSYWAQSTNRTKTAITASSLSPVSSAHRSVHCAQTQPQPLKQGPAPIRPITQRQTLAGGHYREQSFIDCKMSTGVYEHCTFERCEFSGGNLHSCEINHSKCLGGQFDCCTMVNSIFVGGSFMRSRLMDCTNQGGSFQYCVREKKGEKL